MSNEEINELDIDALDAPFILIQSAGGLALLKSEENEKYIVVDELLDTDTLHAEEIYLRAEKNDELKSELTQGKKVFVNDEETAVKLFNSMLDERKKTDTEQDIKYRQYLYEMREKVGEDYLEIAMSKAEYFKEEDAATVRPVSQNDTAAVVAKDVPTYDIHSTYRNEKLYEKNTPLNLRARPQFVCWKYEWLDGKWKKIPYNPNTGNKASSVSPKTWSDFETACKAVDKYNFDGVGIMFSRGLIGIDIDHCIDADGKVDESAREVINTVNSYTELSPSGTGVHILAFGELPGTRTRNGTFEMYQKGRFFTLTGKLFENQFRKIPKTAETETAIKLMYDKYVNVKKDLLREPTPVSDKPLTYSDEEILAKCRKSVNADRFERLWGGDWSQYAGRGEQSSADAALVGMLAYYTDDNYQIDRLFRQSGLMRDKWDEYRGDMTYGQMTINSILNAPNRPKYNPKYYYETQIKPKFQNNNSSSEWTTIKLSKDNFVQDYQRCKNFKITQGELAGAKFFYPNSMITENENGYNLKVKSDFTFKVRPKNSNTDVELSCGELRQALSGQPLNKTKKATAPNKGVQNKSQSELE